MGLTLPDGVALNFEALVDATSVAGVVAVGRETIYACASEALEKRLQFCMIKVARFIL